MQFSCAGIVKHAGISTGNPTRLVAGGMHRLPLRVGEFVHKTLLKAASFDATLNFVQAQKAHAQSLRKETEW